MVYSHQGEFDLAIAESSRAVELDPTLALAFINRGHAYIQQGELDLAVADLTNAIDLDPTLKSAFHNRGIAYLHQGYLDLAVADLTKAIELQPDFAFTYLDRAQALLEQGDDRAALADAEAAIELDPDLAPGYYAIVDRLQTLGESAPLPFTLDLPDGWVGGRLPAGYRQALLDYGGVHPDCADRVMELVDASEGVDGLYMAAAACGPYADLVVTVDDIPSELSADEVLDIGVAAWMEELASPGDPDLVGAPTVITADSPFEGGRVMHWTWGQAGDGSSFTGYLFASGGRLWDLTFTSDWAPESNDSNDATFVAIATSFRLTQPAPLSARNDEMPTGSMRGMKS